MADIGIFVSDWPINKKCFPLKPLWQLEPNFTEMVFRKSSIDNYHLVTMWQKSWPPIMQLFFFLPHLAKGYVSFCHHLASILHHKLSHLNLFLWNHWTKFNQSWFGWSIGDPISILCPILHSRWWSLLKINILCLFLLSPFKIVFNSLPLHSRWQPLLKI